MKQSIEELTNKMLDHSEGNREALMSYVLGMLEGTLVAVDRLGASAEETVPAMRTIFSAFTRHMKQLGALILLNLINFIKKPWY